MLFLIYFLVLFCGATDLREIVQFVKKLNEIERMKIQQKKNFQKFSALSHKEDITNSICESKNIDFPFKERLTCIQSD